MAFCVLSAAGVVQGQGLAQQATDSTAVPQQQSSSTQETTSTQVTRPTSITGQGGEPWRDVSWSTLPKNILHDQKNIWLFPVQLAHGKHWVPVVVVVGLTAGLLVADSHVGSYFRQTTSFNGFNKAASSNITGIEMAVVPLTFYAVGLARKDTYAQKTGILVGEAVVDSLVVYGVMNVLTRRQRPLDIAPNGNFSETFYHNNKLLGTSFPSGHTISAFSIATIFAERYKKHRWVPWVAYGAACMIAFSRVSIGEHFPSDVFVGAALGFSISHFVVLRGN